MVFSEYWVSSNIITTKGTKSHEGNGLHMNPFVILGALSGSCFEIKLTHYPFPVRPCFVGSDSGASK